MADDTLQAAVEDAYETELSRLGSSKAVYALTGGEMEAGAVRGAMADRAATWATTFEGWADDPEHGELFGAAAETVADHATAIAAGAGADAPADDPRPMDEALRDLSGSDARLGGLLAWALVADRTLAQAVGFFVGDADPGAADAFRDRRSEVDALLEAAADALEAADEDAAREAANAVVEAAYAGYVETLEGLGVKVKPVC